jgi:DHA1 family inner membrane transport protein
MYQITHRREQGLLWLLALTQFTVIMDFMVMMPLGPQIMRAFAIGPAAFATAVSAYAVCSGLSSLFAATYIDRFDRRHLLLTVYALFALSNLGCALASNFHMLLIARAFAGLTGGVMSSVVMAIIGDVVPPQRRGAATGTIMTSFSLAAVAGVPAGVYLGAKFGWSTPFYLLVALSIIIWIAGAVAVPSLAAHLQEKPHPLSEVLPNLIKLITEPRHMTAFSLTFFAMVANMIVVPFIAPVLVANYGVGEAQLSWIYMAGGGITLFTSRIVGRLVDRFGKQLMFRILGSLSILPMLFFTHMPQMSFIAIVFGFAIYMMVNSSRIIPLQALMTTVTEPARRGAFLSVNAAIQSLGVGTGSWLGGLLLSSAPDGKLTGYGTNGWVGAAVVVVTLFLVGKVRSAPTPVAAPAPEAARAA